MLRKKKTDRDRENERMGASREASNREYKEKGKKNIREKKNNEQNVDPILFSFFRFPVQTNFDAVYVE